MAAAGLIACSAIVAYTGRQIYKQVVTVPGPDGKPITIAQAERLLQDAEEYNKNLREMYARIYAANAKIAALEPQVRERMIEGLISDAESSDESLRIAALQAIAERGKQSEPAVPRLIKLLESDDIDVRLNAALALGAIGRSAVSRLAEALSSKNVEVRYGAALALGLMGKAAESALPQVKNALNDQAELVRKKAEYASARIEGVSLPGDDHDNTGWSPGAMPELPYYPPQQR
jgi:HEAT repeat protein